jgi:hypothetical protein
VGKTSVALCAAVQLAASGKKVAWLELDTQGPHLAQCWPLRQDVKDVDGVPEFQGGAFADEDGKHQLAYSARSYWNVAFYEKRDPTPEVFQKVACTLSRRTLDYGRRALGSELGALDWHLVEKVVDNLTLFPASCYLKHIDATNQAILTGVAQERLLNYFTRFRDEASEAGFDFLVLDNSPGISIMPANVLRWVIERNGVKGATDSGHHLWFVGGNPWWEMGLIFYELNVMAPAIIQFNPALIVNKIGLCWLRRGDFAPGTRANLARDAEARRWALSRLSCLPLWLGSNLSDEDLTELIIRKSNLALAILAYDLGLERSMTRPGDIWGLVTYDLLERPMARPKDIETQHSRDPEEPRRRWPYWAYEFTLPFMAGALHPLCSKASQPENEVPAPGSYPFSRSVHEALVRPLLARTDRASA